MGLIKVDLLGLGMMAVLKECVELIPRYYGKQIDIAQIPHDDSKVYDSLRKADTIGLFQVESRAQRRRSLATIRTSSTIWSSRSRSSGQGRSSGR